MPATYVIDPQRRLVLTRLIGTVTRTEVDEHELRLIKDPLFQPDFRQLVDLRQLTEILYDSSEVREISRQHAFSPGARRALVAESDAVYGMSRMFATQSETVGQTIEVFRNMAEAEAWLGL